MDDNATELHDRARRYRQLATMVSDQAVCDSIHAFADELDRRAAAADRDAQDDRRDDSQASR